MTSYHIRYFYPHFLPKGYTTYDMHNIIKVDDPKKEVIMFNGFTSDSDSLYYAPLAEVQLTLYKRLVPSIKPNFMLLKKEIFFHSGYLDAMEWKSLIKKWTFTNTSSFIDEVIDSFELFKSNVPFNTDNFNLYYISTSDTFPDIIPIIFPGNDQYAEEIRER